jgi:multidrug efflux pump subunit AcrA (membrane-fusion protein)
LSLWLPGSIQLTAGQSVTLLHEGQQYGGKVLRVASTHWVQVSARFSSVRRHKRKRATPGKSCLAAMPVTASVFLARAVAGQNGSLAHVLRLAADGHTVEKVAVVSGEVLDDRIRIVSGLKAGDSVVVAGAAAIVPGTRVTPMQLREGANHE